MQRVHPLPPPACPAVAWAPLHRHRDLFKAFTAERPLRSAARHCITRTGVVIGIDLGTSNVAVAVIEDGLPRILPDANGRVTSPSIVAFRKDGATLTGFAAREQAAENPLNTFSSVKRLIGRRYEDVRDRAAQLPYRIAASSGERSGPEHGAGAAAVSSAKTEPAAAFGRVRVPQGLVSVGKPKPSAAQSFRGTVGGGEASGAGSARTEVADVEGHATTMGEAESGSGAVMLECPALGRLLAPEEVSAALMRELADRARRHLGAALTGAVVTVPAHFDERQRAATLLAAQMAGLPRVQLLQEPVAAAMAYGLGRRNDAETVLVLDLGGGTYDVSLLESFDGILEVVCTDGDAWLGGDDVDCAIAEWTQEQHAVRGEDWVTCWNASGGSSVTATRKLLASAEAAKVALSIGSSTAISTPLCGDLKMTAEQLTAIAAPLMRRLGAPLARVAAETFLTWDSWPAMFDPASSPRERQPAVGVDRFAPPPRRIAEVVLVGGATRMPAVRAAAEQLIGRPPCASIDPELCVALGAAVHAGVLSGDIRDGLELMDGRYSAGWHDRAFGFA